jgi:RNA polymerase sigma-70 factor (ECF subfamily)
LTELDQLCRAEWGRLLSALICSTRHFDIAEEALQDAFEAAVADWAKGAPRNPRGWLYGTARHKAIDRLRRRVRFADKQSELAALAEVEDCLVRNFRAGGACPRRPAEQN